MLVSQKNRKPAQTAHALTKPCDSLVSGFGVAMLPTTEIYRKLAEFARLSVETVAPCQSGDNETETRTREIFSVLAQPPQKSSRIAREVG